MTAVSNEQYAVYWIDLEPTKGAEMNKIRPSVVLSPNIVNSNLKTVIVAPITSKEHLFPTRVQVQVNGVHGWVVLDQMRGVDKRRLCNKIGRLSDEEIQTIKGVIKEMLVD